MRRPAIAASRDRGDAGQPCGIGRRPASIRNGRRLEARAAATSFAAAARELGSVVVLGLETEIVAPTFGAAALGLGDVGRSESDAARIVRRLEAVDVWTSPNKPLQPTKARHCPSVTSSSLCYADASAGLRG